VGEGLRAALVCARPSLLWLRDVDQAVVELVLEVKVKINVNVKA